MKQRSAFTAVELLVAIAIVAIIAAILFPVFMKAREKARQVSCMSNEKQLGLGVLQYMQDNDEIYPSAAGGGDRGTLVSGGWMYYSKFPADDASGPKPSAFNPAKGSLFPYLRSENVYVCPSDADGKVTGDSYAYNSCLTSPSKAIKRPHGVIWPGKYLAKITNPSGTLLFAEEGMGTLPLSTNDGLFNMSGYHAPGFDYRSYSARHSVGTNIAFADGHVKYMPVNAAIASRLPTAGGADYCNK